MCFQDPVKDLRWQGCECSIWICLNNAEYDRICWHIPEKTEYHRILNVSVQYIAHGNCTNYWAVIETDMYSKYCQTFKIERFAKRTMSECRCKTINFSVLGVGGGGWRLCRSRALWQTFRQKQEAPQRNILEIFVLNTLKTTL